MAIGSGSRRKTPLGRVIDISITVFLVAAMVYLARDMLRSGRFTFLKFDPLALSTGQCRLSPPSKDVVKAWRTLVRNSKKSSWPKVMAQGGGRPSLVVEVLGPKGKVLLSFYPLVEGNYFIARGDGKQLVFQVDSWTYNRFMEALEKGCRGGKGNGD